MSVHVRAAGALAFFVSLSALAANVGATPFDAIAYERFHVGAGAAVDLVHGLESGGSRGTRYGSTDRLGGAGPLLGATIDAGYRFTRSFKLDVSFTFLHGSGVSGSPPYQEDRSGTVFRLPVLATIVAPMTSRDGAEISAGFGMFHGVASRSRDGSNGSVALTGVFVEVRAALYVRIVGELDAVLRFSAFYGLGFLGRDFGVAHGIPVSLGVRYRF